jgi:hypothetical protein
LINRSDFRCFPGKENISKAIQINRIENEKFIEISNKQKQFGRRYHSEFHISDHTRPSPDKEIYVLGDQSFENNERSKNQSDEILDSCSENGNDFLINKSEESKRTQKQTTKTLNGPISEKIGLPTEFDFIFTNFYSFSEFYVRKSSDQTMFSTFINILNEHCEKSEICFSDNEIEQLHIGWKRSNFFTLYLILKSRFFNDFGKY